MRKSKKHKNIADSYTKYEQIADDKVDKRTYIDINKLYNKFLINKALEGHIVTLPGRLGTLSVQGKVDKPRINEKGQIVGLAPDWVGTKKLWDSNPEAKEKKQLVYCLNKDTDGVRYKWLWSKFNSPIENKKLYSLILTRENKRSVYKKLKEGFNNFIVKY